MANSKWEEVKDKLILVEGWARDGLTDEQIANNLGIGKTTFYRMCKKHVELLEHLKKGKEIIDYEVENALLRNALNGNTTAQIFWLKNRKPKQWKDKVNVESSDDELTKVEQLLNKIKEEANNDNNR